MLYSDEWPSNRPCSRWEQHVRKDVREKEEYGKKQRREEGSGKITDMERLGCEMMHKKWQHLRKSKIQMTSVM